MVSLLFLYDEIFIDTWRGVGVGPDDFLQRWAISLFPSLEVRFWASVLEGKRRAAIQWNACQRFALQIFSNQFRPEAIGGWCLQIAWLSVHM